MKCRTSLEVYSLASQILTHHGFKFFQNKHAEEGSGLLPIPVSIYDNLHTILNVT